MAESAAAVRVAEETRKVADGELNRIDSESAYNDPYIDQEEVDDGESQDEEENSAIQPERDIDGPAVKVEQRQAQDPVILRHGLREEHAEATNPLTRCSIAALQVSPRVSAKRGRNKSGRKSQPLWPGTCPSGKRT